MFALNVIVALVGLYFYEVSGHGRLVKPPSRSSMWRKEYGNYKTKVNVNDNQLFCGGRGGLKRNNNTCGVCGDPFDGIRENEAGGKYASGIIVGNYTINQLLDVTIELTANHKGYFEFRLCKNDDTSKAITHECLNKNLLVIAKAPIGGKKQLTRYYVPSFNQQYTFKLRLPMGLTCTQCVLQWKYHTGNDWACEGEGINKTCGLGYGLQEEFYGCSDVAIQKDGKIKETTTVQHPSTATVGGTTSSVSPTARPTPEQVTDKVTSKPSMKTTTVPAQTTPKATRNKTICKGVKVWKLTLDSWCESNCKHVPSYCPVSHCICQ